MLGKDITADEVNEAMAFIASIVGLSNLEKRWAELECQRRSAVRGGHVAQAYGLELAHHDAVKDRALELGWPSPVSDPPLLRLYSFAVTFRRLHAMLSEHARNRLTGSLTGQYLGDVGLRPIVYEMAIVQHLSRMGFRIEFNDLEQGGGFDFLAVDADGTAIEVECKHLSADVGRKIHRNEAYALLDLLAPVLAENAETLSDGQVLILEVPDRLESSRPRMDEIVGLVTAVFQSPSRHAASGVASASLVDEDAERPSTLWDSGLHFGARFGKLSVILKSAKADSVVEAVEKKLKKDAKRQFSKLRPSVLFAQVSDLTAAQLVELARAQKHGVSAIQRMASQILHSREHLSAVSLTTLGEPTTHTGPGSSVGDRGVTFSFSKLSSNDPAHGPVRLAIHGPDA